MEHNKIIKRINLLLDKEIKNLNIPVVTDNTIVISYVKIVSIQEGYEIINCKTNKLIGFTHSKAAALALAKSTLGNEKREKEIILLDTIVEKNDNDKIFYNYTIKKTKNKITKFSTKNRREIAIKNSFNARKALQAMILGDDDK